MSSVKTKLRDAKQTEESAALEVIGEAHGQAGVVQLGMMLGAAGTMQALATSCSSKVIRILRAIRDSKEYRRLGYSRFEEFLDGHPSAPMKYDKFNARDKALASEGDSAFDTLNELGIPLSTRKLLKGSVTVEGDKIYIGENDAEQVIPLKDRDRVVETIKALAAKVEEQGRTIDRHAATIKHGEKENKKLQKKLDEARQPGEPRSPFLDARSTALVALGALIRQTRALNPVEREQFRLETLNLLTEPWTTLHEAFGFETALQLGPDTLSAHVSDSALEALEN